MAFSIDDLIDGKRVTALDDLPEVGFPQETLITKYAMEKAFRVCKTLRKNVGSLEWYSLLLGTREDLDIAQELLIPFQKNTDGHTKLKPEDLAKALEELKEKHGDLYVPIGWLHSHVDFTARFSPMDNENIETVLNSVHLNTRGTFGEPLKLIEGDLIWQAKGGNLIAGGGISTDGRLVLTGADAKLRRIIKKAKLGVEVHQPVLMGWSYNIVINEKRQSHAEIAIHLEKPLEGFVDESKYETPIVVVDDERFKKDLDVKALEAEVEKNIKERYVPPPVHRDDGVFPWLKGKVRGMVGKTFVFSRDGVPQGDRQGSSGRDVRYQGPRDRETEIYMEGMGVNDSVSPNIPIAGGGEAASKTIGKYRDPKGPKGPSIRDCDIGHFVAMYVCVSSGVYQYENVPESKELLDDIVVYVMRKGSELPDVVEPSSPEDSYPREARHAPASPVYDSSQLWLGQGIDEMVNEASGEDPARAPTAATVSTVGDSPIDPSPAVPAVPAVPAAPLGVDALPAGAPVPGAEDHQSVAAPLPPVAVPPVAETPYASTVPFFGFLDPRAFSHLLKFARQDHGFASFVRRFNNSFGYTRLDAVREYHYDLFRKRK